MRKLRFDRLLLTRAIVLAAMLLSGTASTYFMMRDQAASESVRKRFVRIANEPPERQRPEWRPRIASLALARWVMRDTPAAKRPEVIARYFAGGYFATGVAYIATSVRAAPFMLLGTLAALVYCNTERAEDTWYPWDMPALVCAALISCLAVRRQVVPLALAVVAAVPFKETLLVMALFFLFLESRTWRFRVSWAAGTIAVGIALRLGIEAWLGGQTDHAHFMHVHGKPERELRVFDNLRHIFSLDLNHVFWVNAGLWAVLFLIPSRDRMLSGFRVIAACFYAGLLLAGSYNEFRIFLEALPGALLLAHGLFDAPLGRAAEVR